LPTNRLRRSSGVSANDAHARGVHAKGVRVDFPAVGEATRRGTEMTRVTCCSFILYLSASVLAAIPTFCDLLSSVDKGHCYISIQMGHRPGPRLRRCIRCRLSSNPVSLCPDAQLPGTLELVESLDPLLFVFAFVVVLAEFVAVRPTHSPRAPMKVRGKLIYNLLI